jgi:hypothetical protein
VWSLIALALSAAHPAQPKIAVMDVVIKSGAPAGAGQVLSEAIVAEVRKRSPNAQVLSAEEIRSMIQVEGEKQQLGCHSEKELACLTEIGGALGVERVVIGSLGRLGKTYVYSLKLVDVTKAQVLRSGSLELKTQEDDELLSATTKLVAQLFPGPNLEAPANMTESAPITSEPAPAAAVTQPAPSHSHLTSILLGIGGLACGGVAIYGLTRVLAYNSDVSTINARKPGGVSYSQFQSDHNDAQIWQPLSIGLAVLGAAGLTGAVLTW